MNPKNILITGANRGIGLQLVKDLLTTNPKNLIATCREPEKATELQALAKSNTSIKILTIDLETNCGDEQKLCQFVSQVDSALKGEGLNLLINNAGILVGQPIDMPTLMKSFTVNAFAPLLLCKALMPLLKKAAGSGDKSHMSPNRACVAMVSTKVASIDDNKGGGMFPYRGSKVALNMFTKNLSIEHGKDGILFLLLHPGWVQTDLGGPNAKTTVKDSSQGMIKVIAKSTEADQCKFYDFTGNEIPW